MEPATIDLFRSSLMLFFIGGPAIMIAAMIIGVSMYGEEG